MQNILHDANKTFTESMVGSQQKAREAEASEAAPVAGEPSGEAREATCQAERRTLEPRGQGKDHAGSTAVAETGDSQAQLREKNAIIQNYEKQNRDFIDEIAELQVQICSQKKRLGSLEQQNIELEEKIAKLESELEE